MILSCQDPLRIVNPPKNKFIIYQDYPDGSNRPATYPEFYEIKRIFWTIFVHLEETCLAIVGWMELIAQLLKYQLTRAPRTGSRTSEEGVKEKFTIILIDSLSLMEIWSFSRARNVWVKPWIDCYFDDTNDIKNVNIFVVFVNIFVNIFQLTLSSKESSTEISSFCCETCTLNAFKWSWLLPRYDCISGALEWWLTDCCTSELGWYVSLGTLEIISLVASAIFLNSKYQFKIPDSISGRLRVTFFCCPSYMTRAI